MKNYSKLLAALGFVAAIFILGALIGWLGGKGTGSPNIPPVANTLATGTRPVANSTGNTQLIPPGLASSTEGGSPTNDAAPPRVAASDLVTNWEERVDGILTAETDDTNKVQQLFALFPHLPDEAKAEVAQHLSNLTSDTDYPALGELLKDGKLPDGALDVLMSDALNRPNSVKLPELLAVAQETDHPKAGEAKDILALFLDQDYGTDWAQWQDKVRSWLKDNPD